MSAKLLGAFFEFFRPDLGFLVLIQSPDVSKESMLVVSNHVRLEEVRDMQQILDVEKTLVLVEEDRVIPSVCINRLLRVSEAVGLKCKSMIKSPRGQEELDGQQHRVVDAIFRRITKDIVQ